MFKGEASTKRIVVVEGSRVLLNMLVVEFYSYLLVSNKSLSCPLISYCSDQWDLVSDSNVLCLCGDAHVHSAVYFHPLETVFICLLVWLDRPLLLLQISH